MKKELKTILKKINKYPLFLLSAPELKKYFEYRLENLLCKKIILVKDELLYLFGETGPGNLRIDPELINNLTTQTSFIHSGNISALEELLINKLNIEKYIEENNNSLQLQKIFVRLLNNYLDGIKIINRHPFIISAQFKSIPINCLICNYDWVLPNSTLFSFLQKCQINKQLPIIISKKIHGALFPIFKNLSILGCNTYKIYMPYAFKKVLSSTKLAEKMPTTISYNNQFEFATKEYIKNIVDESWQGDLIKNFFENILPKHIESYYSIFINSKHQINDNFIDTVSQFKKNKVNKKLIENYIKRTELIKELQKII